MANGIYGYMFGEGGDEGDYGTGIPSGGGLPVPRTAPRRRDPCPEGQRPAFRNGKWHCIPITVTPPETPDPDPEPPAGGCAGQAPSSEYGSRSAANCSECGGVWKSTAPAGQRCFDSEDHYRRWVQEGDGRNGGGGDPGGGGPPGDGAGDRTPMPDCPPGQARVWKDGVRGGEIICQPIVRGGTPAEIRASLPEFDPLVDQPGPFRPPSLADVLSDPRYLTAAREQDRAIRGTAAASGVRGAPLLAAQAEGRQGLLGGLADRLFGQRLQGWGANVQRGQDTYNRLAGNWQRAWAPTQFGLNFGLQQAGLGHGIGQDLWRRGFDEQREDWRQWWAPESQARQFGQQRWAIGQNNLLSIIQALAGGGVPGLAAP